MRRSVLFFLLILMSLQILLAPSLFAQTSTPEPEPLNLPQWVKDLRRAEIVAFGSFPFTMFFAMEIMDTYRYFSHNKDARYAPWPAKGAGAVNMNTDEAVITIMSAIGGSLLISLADYLIVRHKRIKAEKAQRDLPRGDPIIIREPYPQDETAEEAAPAETP
jgi:hypothetical protein